MFIIPWSSYFPIKNEGKRYNCIIFLLPGYILLYNSNYDFYLSELTIQLPIPKYVSYYPPNLLIKLLPALNTSLKIPDNSPYILISSEGKFNLLYWSDKLHFDFVLTQKNNAQLITILTTDFPIICKVLIIVYSNGFEIITPSDGVTFYPSLIKIKSCVLNNRKLIFNSSESLFFVELKDLQLFKSIAPFTYSNLSFSSVYLLSDWTFTYSFNSFASSSSSNSILMVKDSFLEAKSFDLIFENKNNVDSLDSSIFNLSSSARRLQRLKNDILNDCNESASNLSSLSSILYLINPNSKLIPFSLSYNIRVVNDRILLVFSIKNNLEIKSTFHLFIQLVGNNKVCYNKYVLIEMDSSASILREVFLNIENLIANAPWKIKIKLLPAINDNQIQSNDNLIPKKLISLNYWSSTESIDSLLLLTLRKEYLPNDNKVQSIFNGTVIFDEDNITPLAYSIPNKSNITALLESLPNFDKITIFAPKLIVTFCLPMFMEEQPKSLDDMFKNAFLKIIIFLFSKPQFDLFEERSVRPCIKSNKLLSIASLLSTFESSFAYPLKFQMSGTSANFTINFPNLSISFSLEPVINCSLSVLSLSISLRGDHTFPVYSSIINRLQILTQCVEIHNGINSELSSENHKLFKIIKASSKLVSSWSKLLPMYIPLLYYKEFVSSWNVLLKKWNKLPENSDKEIMEKWDEIRRELKFI